MSDQRKIFKLVILGDDDVKTKSTFRHTYLDQGFTENHSKVVGAHFAVRRLDIDGKEIVLQLWDLETDETRFNSVREVYYQGALGMLLVFDTKNYSSFEAIPDWIGECLNSTNKEIIPMVLIGLNSEVEREVDYEDAITYASELSEWSGMKVPYVEINIKKEEFISDDYLTFDDVLKDITRTILKYIPTN